MTYSELILSHSPSNYWKLGESSGLTAADSAGSAPGTLSGGITLGQPGALADGTTAMTFDGTTGKVTTAANVLIPLTATVEVWIKQAVGLLGQRPAVSTGALGVSGFFLGTSLNGTPPPAGQKTFAYSLSGGSGLTNVDTGTWHHLVYVLNSGSASVYIDGVFDVTQAGFGRSAPTTLPVILGWNGDTGEFFSGSLDEVAIYPRALTAGEIAQHYSVGRLSGTFPAGSYADKVITAGPSNYWRLGESSGTTAVDIISAKNGTISGGVTLSQPGALADGNTAMTFDGVDDQIVTAAAVAFPLACTCEVWMKHPAGATDRPLFSLASEAPRIGVSANRLNVYDGPNGAGGSSTALVSDGVWQHCVFVFNGSTLSFYLDGVLSNTIPAVRTIPGNAVAGIARDTDFPGGDARGFWSGGLDEVAIYPRALTPTEISDHYAARLVVSVPSAGCDHTTVWSKHLATLSAPTVESERAYLANLYGGGSDFSTLVSRWLQAITCGAAVVTPAAPTLSTVSPNTGTQGTMVTVTLTGTNFVTGATGVSVNGVGITVVNIQVTSPTTLTADLAIAAAAPPTARSLTVSTAGGSSSQAFTVAGSDASFGSVVLLIGADTAVIDESSRARTLTLVGNVARTTLQAKFGAGSLTFDGTADWVQLADSPDWDFPVGVDFTLEGWFRFLVKTDNQALLGQWDSGGILANCNWFLYLTGGFLTWRIISAAAASDLTVAFAPTLGQWYHLAVERAGTTLRIYRDGAIVASRGSDLFDLVDPAGRMLTLGAIGTTDNFASLDFNGQMDEVRITKGLARYNGAFTPPTAAFPRS
jgi:hypothetical protein